MEQFRRGDINEIKYRQALVDTFIDRIYLYDDKMTILYNAQDSHSDVVDLDEIQENPENVRLGSKWWRRRESNPRPKTFI